MSKYIKKISNSKYIEKIENLPIASRCSMHIRPALFSTEKLAARFEELDADPPTVERVAWELRHGAEKEAHILLLWMIVNGKDVSARVKVGDVETTLLIYAAEINAFDVALVLLGQNVDIDAVDSRGFSALYLTTDKHIAKALRRAGATEICKEDLVKVDQGKKLCITMDRFERMALCDMAVAAVDPLELDESDFTIASWYLLDYMLEHCENFSFLSFVYALANSSLEFPEMYDGGEEGFNLYAAGKMEHYIRIDIPPSSYLQFRRLSYEDPKLHFHADAENLVYHPTDEEDILVKDLRTTGPACLLVMREALKPIDTAVLSRAPWGFVSMGYGAGKF